MQVAQLDRYAADFKLVVRTIPTPVPAENEVLVKVKAAAVNPLDNLIGTGQLKLIQNYSLPVTMGNEIAGVVTAVGRLVTDIEVGAAVYARLPIAKMGGFAEYVAVDQDAVALKPTNLDFEHSVAVPLTGLTAYQGLTENLQATAGDTVLIPGGSGSFGQLAIPIATKLGLNVLVSGNARGRDKALKLGATDYFDYRQVNYWDAVSSVDAVIDTLGKSELAHELAVLKPGGKLLSLRMGPNRQFAKANHFAAWKRALFTLAGAALDHQAKKAGASYQFIFVRSEGQQLRQVTKIVEEQAIVPEIEETVFRLADINAAIKLVNTGHPHGKVIIRF